MKKLFAIFIFFFLLVNLHANPLHKHYKHSIIIDTDCAIDDMRAISLLLSLPTITIKAIMVSDGALTPKEGAIKIRSLLQEFNRDSIPVMIGEKKDIHPSWREFNRQLSWGKETNIQHKPIQLKEIASIITNSKEEITLVCLGPLTNIAQLIKKHSNIISNVEDMLWYNESINPLKGFNYESDTAATKLLFSSSIKIKILSNLNIEDAVFDANLFNFCKNTNTIQAKAIYNTHNQPLVIKKINENHFKLWDELVAAFLTNPELFSIDILSKNKNIRYCTNYSIKAVQEVLKDIISDNYTAGAYIAFMGFPIKPALYTYDIRLIMDSAITRYGLEEWKACVMTDEFHGHLGVFSIVGAKMGLKARDYFGVETDLLQVVSFAGSKPPYSCMNDGIQVSTGATLGQGTIQIRTDSISLPKAIFTYNGKSIEIKLKDKYLSQLKNNINKGISQFGLADENYWTFIRQNALKYWLNWDRNKIFELVEISN